MPKKTQLPPMPIIIPDVEEMASVFEDNYRDGETPRFTEIHAPGSGGRQFIVNTVIGETTLDVIQGIVLGWYSPRVLYMAAYDPKVEDSKPDCFSDDGTTGIGEPGGPCASCEFSQWGSGRDGAGQACTQFNKVLIAPLEGGFPFILRLPPTSLRPFRDYRNLLSSAGLALRNVVTSFNLIQQKGESATRIIPTAIGKVPESQYQDVFDLHQGLSAFLPGPIAYPPMLASLRSQQPKALPAPVQSVEQEES